MCPPRFPAVVPPSSSPLAEAPSLPCVRAASSGGASVGPRLLIVCVRPAPLLARREKGRMNATKISMSDG